MNPLFLIRLSAIGDVIIALHSAKQLHDNGFNVVFVTSRAMASLVEQCLWLTQVMYVEDLANSQKTMKKNDLLLWPQKVTIPVIDLQVTGRSRRAISLLKKEFVANQWKMKLVRQKKNSLWRFFLVFWSFFRSLFLGQGMPRNTLISAGENPYSGMLNHYQRNKIFIDDFCKKNNSQKTIETKVKPLDTNTIFDAVPANKLILKELFNTQTNLDLESHFIAIFPGASYFNKSWPKEYFRILIQDLLSLNAGNIILCGSKSEEPIGKFIDTLHNQRIFNLIGKCTLAETLMVISASEYVVCGDTFAAHAAFTFDKPASILFGPTSPEFGFFPISTKIQLHYSFLKCSPCSRHGSGRCRYQNLKCMRSITESSIRDCILNRIKKST